MTESKPKIELKIDCSRGRGDFDPDFPKVQILPQIHSQNPDSPPQSDLQFLPQVQQIKEDKSPIPHSVSDSFKQQKTGNRPYDHKNNERNYNKKGPNYEQNRYSGKKQSGYQKKPYNQQQHGEYQQHEKSYQPPKENQGQGGRDFHPRQEGRSNYQGQEGRSNYQGQEGRSNYQGQEGRSNYQGQGGRDYHPRQEGRSNYQGQGGGGDFRGNKRFQHGGGDSSSRKPYEQRNYNKNFSEFPSSKSTSFASKPFQFGSKTQPENPVPRSVSGEMNNLPIQRTRTEPQLIEKLETPAATAPPPTPPAPTQSSSSKESSSQINENTIIFNP